MIHSNIIIKSVRAAACYSSWQQKLPNKFKRENYVLKLHSLPKSLALNIRKELRQSVFVAPRLHKLAWKVSGLFKSWAY